jgi:hypothetical protein
MMQKASIIFRLDSGGAIKKRYLLFFYVMLCSLAFAQQPQLPVAMGDYAIKI